MFEDLTSKLEQAVKIFRGENRISDVNIESAIKSVRKALLEADVSLSIVNNFLNEVKEEALGAEVLQGITPEQKFIDIVHKKLVSLMGGSNAALNISDDAPTVIMLVGLQGAGKTTVAAKLGLYLKEKKKRVLLIAADTFRPAAKEQLIILGEQVGIKVFTGEDCEDPESIAMKGKNKATLDGYDAVIIDTAGRLYIDHELMNEVTNVKRAICPHETLLVVDSMIGQEAADLAKAFNDELIITGVILTKLDGDSRGGSSLSVRQVSGKPIKFIGTGERVEALEPFYPDRMASRILGMGDILTLVDKAQREVELTDVISMQKRLEEATFDFSDFLQQMKMIRRMGSLGGIINLIPGMNKIDEKSLKTGELQLKRIQAMISSMTYSERRDPKLLSNSTKRKRRIAQGSGHTEIEVNKMINDFERMRNMMQHVVKGDISKLISNPKITSKSTAQNMFYTQGGKKNIPEKSRPVKKHKGFFEV
jgi:signal recognition particle subunit SRP54